MVSVPRWLHVGMSIKRWLVLLVVGIALLSLSAGYVLRAVYSLDVRFPSWVGVLTLQFLGREVRGSLFLVCGTILTTVALLRLNRTVINALLPRGHAPVVDLLYRQRHLRRGPKVVAIGGGNGLSVLLSGLKRPTGNLPAVVAGAHDWGGSR